MSFLDDLRKEWRPADVRFAVCVWLVFALLGAVIGLLAVLL